MNAWILTITYGFCFGVELTMTNVAAFYFYEYHGHCRNPSLPHPLTLSPLTPLLTHPSLPHPSLPPSPHDPSRPLQA